MTKSQLPPLLPDTVLPGHQLADLVARLEACQDEFYQAHDPHDLEAMVSRHLKPNEIELLRKELGSENPSREEWDSVLGRLKDEVVAWPVLEVELAWQPGAAFLDFLSDWFGRQHMGPARLMVRYRPEILGGLVVGFEGKRYDLSLRNDVTALHGQLPAIAE